MATKKVDSCEFRDLTLQELCQKELELRNDLLLLRLRRKIGQLEKTHRFSKIRRDIARILTLKVSKGAA